MPIAAAAAAYLAFGIIFIIDDENICSYQSPLWVFAVVTLIFPCVLFTCAPLSSFLSAPLGGSDTIRAATAFGLLALALVIYGLYTLYSGVVCEHMHDTGLWIWSYIVVYLYIFYLVCLVAMCILHCHGIIDMENPTGYVEKPVQDEPLGKEEADIAKSFMNQQQQQQHQHQQGSLSSSSDSSGGGGKSQSVVPNSLSAAAPPGASSNASASKLPSSFLKDVEQGKEEQTPLLPS